MGNVRVEAVVIGPGATGFLKVMIRRGADEDVVDVPIHKLPAGLHIPNSPFVAVVVGRDVVRVETAGPAWLEIQTKIRTILNREWDPIGVADEVEDEYDCYIEEIYFMLSKSVSGAIIADRLRAIETPIGLRRAPFEALMGIAEKLKKLSLPPIGEQR